MADFGDDEYWIERERKWRLSVMTAQQRRNNPHAELMGSYTNRCGQCGAIKVFDDNMRHGPQCACEGGGNG